MMDYVITVWTRVGWPGYSRMSQVRVTKVCVISGAEPCSTLRGGFNSVFLLIFRDFEILGVYSGFNDFFVILKFWGYLQALRYPKNSKSQALKKSWNDMVIF